MVHQCQCQFQPLRLRSIPVALVDGTPNCCSISLKVSRKVPLDMNTNSGINNSDSQCAEWVPDHSNSGCNSPPFPVDPLQYATITQWSEDRRRRNAALDTRQDIFVSGSRRVVMTNDETEAQETFNRVLANHSRKAPKPYDISYGPRSPYFQKLEDESPPLLYEDRPADELALTPTIRAQALKLSHPSQRLKTNRLKLSRRAIPRELRSSPLIPAEHSGNEDPAVSKDTPTNTRAFEEPSSSSTCSLSEKSFILIILLFPCILSFGFVLVIICFCCFVLLNSFILYRLLSPYLFP
ncbi:hypothetical protein DL93DRAFT_2084365 [Clavulina sp. PMI_390]|nr:hypothetical protein DL93DRAFT_2084365 [Clavulina sp. PMI_390]